jgi:hypothetical protein
MKIELNSASVAPHQPLFYSHFGYNLWFEVAHVAIIHPQAYFSFYSCLIWHCSNKVLQISRKWPLDVYECKKCFHNVKIGFS